MALTFGFNFEKVFNAESRYNPRLIPNQVGFRFTARLNDGSELKCRVEKKVVTHYVVNDATDEQVAFGTIIDWKY